LIRGKRQGNPLNRGSKRGDPTRTQLTQGKRGSREKKNQENGQRGEKKKKGGAISKTTNGKRSKKPGRNPRGKGRGGLRRGKKKLALLTRQFYCNGGCTGVKASWDADVVTKEKNILLRGAHRWGVVWFGQENFLGGGGTAGEWSGKTGKDQRRRRPDRARGVHRGVKIKAVFRVSKKEPEQKPKEQSFDGGVRWAPLWVKKRLSTEAGGGINKNVGEKKTPLR